MLLRPPGWQSLQRFQTRECETLTVVLALVIGYPCFRFKIVGHYFALVTLALAEVVRLVIVATREVTGGSLGLTPKPGLPDEATASLWSFQFSNRVVWFYIVLACWLFALWVWRKVDQSMLRDTWRRCYLHWPR